LLPIINQHFNGDLKGKTIAIWGLAFKPYTDDIREAPALENIQALLAAGAKLTAYDPEAMDNVKNVLGSKITYAHTSYAALDDADALVIMTEWPMFRTPEFSKMNLLLKNKVIFDGRNLYELEQMKELGYTYYSVGRETITQEVEQPA
jgi:UDPglucose 6-dehydrogenase